MSDKKYLATGVGLCALDYICILEKFPGPEQKLEARHFSRQGGGPVPTALCAISQFGEKAAFIGKCGDDPEGIVVKGEIALFGVETAGMVLDNFSRTPRAFIWVDQSTGERTVVLDRTEISDLQPAELNREMLQDCRFLHLDGRESEAGIAAAKIAREAGAQVVLDAGSTREKIQDLLPLVDHMVVSKQFAEKFTGQQEPGAGAMKLLARGFKSVAVTLGRFGAVCASGGDFFQQDAFEVEVIDTTGAGDVFHGAYIYGLGKGWDLPTVVEFSSAAAALKCKRIGGRQGIPSVDEVVQFLEESKGRL